MKRCQICFQIVKSALAAVAGMNGKPGERRSRKDAPIVIRQIGYARFMFSIVSSVIMYGMHGDAKSRKDALDVMRF